MTTQTSSVPVVQLRNIGKTYRTGPVEVAAVRDVTLNIDPGEFVAVMGASGSGKSTLMNILGCLDRPTSGSYLLDGIAVAQLNRKELAKLRNKKLGFVFQNFNLLARTSALENVELPMFYSYPLVSLRAQRQRAIRALARVGLGASNSSANMGQRESPVHPRIRVGHEFRVKDHRRRFSSVSN